LSKHSSKRKSVIGRPRLFNSLRLTSLQLDTFFLVLKKIQIIQQMYCLYYKNEKKNTNKRSRFECKKCNVGLCI